MKRLTTMLTAAVLALSLAGCTQGKPSLQDVQNALENGSITLEDAVSKGWVTQSWADEYQNARTEEATDKTTSYAVGEFETQTLSGDAFTNDSLSPVTFWAFIDPTQDDAAQWYQTLVEAYDKVRAFGADLLICSKGTPDSALFDNAPFPVILYNDSVKSALSNMGMSSMIDELAHTGNWFVESYFASSWYAKISTEQLSHDADIFMQQYRQLNNAGTSSESSTESAANSNEIPAATLG